MVNPIKPMYMFLTKQVRVYCQWMPKKHMNGQNLNCRCYPKSEHVFIWTQNLTAGGKGGKKNGSNTTKGEKKKSVAENSIALKAVLLRQSSGLFHCGPSLIEHCMLSLVLIRLLSWLVKIQSLHCRRHHGRIWCTLYKEEGSKVIESLTSG